MKFNKFRVPKSSLLNKLADIDENGNYSSPIKSKGKWFAMLIACLSGGWVNIAKIVTDSSALALKIAIWYSLARRQFGSPEKLLMDYSSHQVRIFPMLAENLTYFVAAMKTYEIWQENLPHLLDEKNWWSELCHGLSSAAKAFNSWSSHKIILECWRACGGHGFSHFAVIG